MSLILPITSFPFSARSDKDIPLANSIAYDLCTPPSYFIVKPDNLDINKDNSAEVTVELQENGDGDLDKNEYVVESYEMTEEEIEEENYYDSLEILAQCVQAEAGNQNLEGRRLVVDVILNRVDSPLFPDNIEDVIYAEKQFSCILDGGFDKAGWNMDDLSFQAVEMEVFGNNRLNSNVLYFSRAKVNGRNFFKEGDHWFSY